MNIKSIIGVILFLVYPFLLRLMPFGLEMGEVGMWLLLILILLWVYLVEKRTVSSIGLKKVSWKTILGGLGLGAILFIVFGVTTTAIVAVGLELNQDTAALFVTQPLPFLFLIALRAGVVEEVLYRSYAFERIQEVTGSKVIAGLVPLSVFVLAHLSWGVGHLIFVFIAGGLFTILYAAKRNLVLNIIAHFTVDVFVIILIPILTN